MTLEKQDAELFYQLWFPLLDFVNQKYIRGFRRFCPIRFPTSGVTTYLTNGLPMRVCTRKTRPR